MLSTVCRHCGKPFELDAPLAVNVAEDPSFKEKIADGSAFVHYCPHCDTPNLVSYRLLYHDPGVRIMIWLIPQDSMSQEDTARMQQSVSQIWTSLSDALPDYTFRRVPDPGSLIEKVRIFDCGLEDAAVEMCKHLTRIELSQEEKDSLKSAAIADATLRFRGFGGADNELEFVFALDGTMQSVKASFSVYEDCRAILGRNPEIVPDGPFPQIDTSWINAHFL